MGTGYGGRSRCIGADHWTEGRRCGGAALTLPTTPGPGPCRGLAPLSGLRRAVLLVGVLTLLLALGCGNHLIPVAPRPNVVIILADDLGWGDVRSNNPDSAMTTPHIDGIAQAGVNFTDAHSSAPFCTASRYGLLSGRYAWRTWLQRGGLGGYDRPLLGRDQPTLGTLLQRHGYRTAIIGKWHLGLLFTPRTGDWSAAAPHRGIDFTAPVRDGPMEHGFDEFYGLAHNLSKDVPVYLRDRGFTTVPDDTGGRDSGNIVKDQVQNRLTTEATAFIMRAAAGDQPFFLYLPLNAPHKPLAPGPAFVGITDLGRYGDYVAQIDWTVGEVLDTLERVGELDNTLVIFTSDNGSFMGTVPDRRRTDHVADTQDYRYRVGTHQSNGGWRGRKGTIWEAGHRVPLLAQWPAGLAAGRTVDTTVSLTDLYATLADLLDYDIPDGVAIDSESFLPAAHGATTKRLTPVVHHQGGDNFALRSGRWKMVLEDDPELYDLQQHPGEKRNVALSHPDVVRRMLTSLEQIRAADDATRSADPSLALLSVVGVDLGAFDPAVMDYAGIVRSGAPEVWVLALPTDQDAAAVIQAHGKPPTRRGRRGQDWVILAKPVTAITVTVTAADRVTTATYRITLTLYSD